jgi:hypothetical protein
VNSGGWRAAVVVWTPCRVLAHPHFACWVYNPYSYFSSQAR